MILRTYWNEREETHMKRFMLPSVALMITAFGAVAAADALQSGLQPGDAAGAFNVLDCTGPAKGKTLCYR